MNARKIEIPLAHVNLKGELIFPEKAIGLVLFSHGSGSSRFSPRNKLVAERLNQNGFATLLFDLLTEDEDQVYENRFNIDLLASRLEEATEWLMENKATSAMPIGYFGASTGAASALLAAAHFGKKIKAVVSRGGRPDLALNHLEQITAPTMLIVGQLDIPVIELNKKAFDRIEAPKELRIITGASHLFEEAGKLNEVADIAISWYKQHLVKKERRHFKPKHSY